MKIDGRKLKEQIKKSGWSISYISRELGYSTSWLSWCITNNAMNDGAADTLASKLNIDKSAFASTESEPTLVVSARHENSTGHSKSFDVDVDAFHEACKRHGVSDTINAMSIKMGFNRKTVSHALTTKRMSYPMAFIIKTMYGIEPEEYELKVEEPVQEEEEQPVEEVPAPVQSVDLTEVMKALESIESRLGTMNGDYEASYEKLKRIAELEEKQLEAMEGMSNILREELKHIRRGVEYLVRVWEK